MVWSTLKYYNLVKTGENAVDKIYIKTERFLSESQQMQRKPNVVDIRV